MCHVYELARSTGTRGPFAFLPSLLVCGWALMFPLRLCRSSKLFSFHLQITTCFHEVSCFPCGMASFNADTVPRYSGWVQFSQGKVRGKSEKMRKGEGWREEEKRGRRALIERLWLAVFSGAPGPLSCSNRVVASRGAVKEKSLL